jgi:proton glutamate symport protein
LWPIFIILGIDEPMDMARTATNVTENCLAAAVIVKCEGEFNDEKTKLFSNNKKLA